MESQKIFKEVYNLVSAIKLQLPHEKGTTNFYNLEGLSPYSKRLAFSDLSEKGIDFLSINDESHDITVIGYDKVAKEIKLNVKADRFLPIENVLSLLSEKFKVLIDNKDNLLPINPNKSNDFYIPINQEAKEVV